MWLISYPVPHICINEPSFGTNDSLPPVGGQAITWINTDLLLIRPFGTNMALPLWESVGMRRGFAPIFSIWTIFLPPKFDHVYHFIQILLNAILNFERRTPTDFTWSAPPPPGDFFFRGVAWPR